MYALKIVKTSIPAAIKARFVQFCMICITFLIAVASLFPPVYLLWTYIYNFLHAMENLIPYANPLIPPK